MVYIKIGRNALHCCYFEALKELSQVSYISMSKSVLSDRPQMFRKSQDSGYLSLFHHNAKDHLEFVLFL